MRGERKEERKDESVEGSFGSGVGGSEPHTLQGEGARVGPHYPPHPGRQLLHVRNGRQRRWLLQAVRHSAVAHSIRGGADAAQLREGPTTCWGCRN